MGILDKIEQMKSDGRTERDIMDALHEDGSYNPRQIDDAFSQSKVRNAVFSSEGQDEMRPSIMEQGSEAELPTPPQKNSPDVYAPQTQELDEPIEPSPEEQEYYPQDQGAYAQDYYGAGDYENSPQTQFNSDTTMEISEQVFLKKIAKTNKQIEELNEFKAITQIKVENVDERLKRIEAIIEKLQIAILGKIGSYGDNLEGIKKEMSMMQNSFGKIVSDVVDRKGKKNLASEPLLIKNFPIKKKITKGK